jgi:hypothetical protein
MALKLSTVLVSLTFALLFAALAAAQNTTTTLAATTTTTAPTTTSAPTSTAALYNTGYASPGRPTTFYLFPASPNYSPTSLPGRIYLFRTAASLSAAEVNQVPIVSTTGGDIRQVIIVVVPSGNLAIELLTEADVLATNYTRSIQSTYCHCPLTPSNWAYALPAHATTYPRRDAYLSNGTRTTYLEFGYVTNSSLSGRIYEQRTLDGRIVTYLLDTVPGDTGYSPMRRMYTVTVAGPITSLDALASLPTLGDTGLYYNAPVVSVLGADAAAETFALNTGYYRGRQVQYYHFNGSRITTGMAGATGLRYSRMYMFNSAIQSTPIIDVVPGSTTYSDLWLLVSVQIALPNNVSWPLRSLADVPAAWTRTVTGRYLNCPVVNANSSLADPTHATMMELFYRGETRYCFNFSYTPGCALRPNYFLRRDGDASVVASNDLFSTTPASDLGYTALSWLMPYAVPQQYATGTIRNVASLVSPTALTASAAGAFVNRPIVSDATGLRSASSYQYSTTVGSADGLHDATVRWSVNSSSLDVQIECRNCGGYVGVGFGGTTGTTTHAGVFVLGVIDSAGVSCVRQLVGTGNSRLTLIENLDNILNVTNTAIAVDAFRVTRFQFSRSVTVRNTAFAQYSIGTGTTERLSIVSRGGQLSSCTLTAINALQHDFATSFGSHSWIPNGTIVVTIPPTTAPVTTAIATTTTAAATPAPTNSSWIGSGRYRCDGIMSFTWTVDFTASTIRFDVTMSTGFTGWFGIGFGSSIMTNADIVMIHRTATGKVILDDRKGTAQALPPRDVSQDVTLISPQSGFSTDVFSFKRALDTGDRHTSAQPLSRTTLASQSITHSRGWAHGVLVAYYDLGNGPMFGTRNNTAVSTMYAFVSSLNFTLTSTVQRAIVDLVPGQAGYSDLWDIVYVAVPTTFDGPEVRAVADIPSSWTRVTSPPSTLPTRINCPVVHSSTTINIALTSRDLWYRGSLQKCFQFPALYARSLQTQRMVQIVNNVTNATIDALFDYSPSDVASFTGFVWRYRAVVPSSYVVGSWTSVDTFISLSGFSVVALGVHASVQVVSYNNLTATSTPGPSQTPAVDIIDPAVIAFYDFSEVLHTVNNVASVVLYWKYDSDNSLLYVMLVGYSISGYVSMGFSNTSYAQKQNSDIVLAYLDAVTGAQCIRTMYGEFATGAPSGTPTLLIRNPTVQRIGGATVLRFERTFDASAHVAGRIPTPAQGATSRVIYAVLSTAVSLNCSSQSYTSLYHGFDSPHGSRVINWLGVNTSTTAPGGTPAPTNPGGSVVLTRVDMVRTLMYYRGFAVPVYCAPIDVTGYAGTLAAPTMYHVVFADGQSAQASLVSTTIGFTTYSGLWQIVYVRVPANWTAVSSVAELLYSANPTLGNFTNATAYSNCPIVHVASTIEARDTLTYVKRTIYYEGQLMACFEFDVYSSKPRVDFIWNGTHQIAPVIDSIQTSFRQYATVTSTNAYLNAEGIVSQPVAVSSTVKNCAVVRSELSSSLLGSATSPSSVAFQTSTGYFNGRRVTFYKHQATIRFANEYEVTTNALYIIKNGNSLTASDRQAQWVTNVTLGNGTYSDIWRLVVVDASSTSSSTTFSSAASLSNLTTVETGLYFNCPIVSSGTSFSTTGLITLKSLFFNGQTDLLRPVRYRAEATDQAADGARRVHVQRLSHHGQHPVRRRSRLAGLLSVAVGRQDDSHQRRAAWADVRRSAEQHLLRLQSNIHRVERVRGYSRTRQSRLDAPAGDERQR